MPNYNFKKFYFLVFFVATLLIGQIISLNGQSDQGRSILDTPNKNNKMGESPEGDGFILGLPTMTTGLPSTFVAPVTVEDVSASNPLFSYQFNVLYDPTIIQPTGGNFGCDITGTIGLFVFCNVEPAGVLRVSTTSFGSISGTGVLLNLNFTTTGSAQYGDISTLVFDEDLFFNSLGQQIPRVLQGGQVAILGPTSAPVSVGGRVLTAGGGSIRGATVAFTDSEGNTRTAVTNVFGYYRIDGLTAGRSYVVATRARGYLFEPEVLDVTESLSSFNIFAEN